MALMTVMVENPLEFWPAELGAELIKDCPLGSAGFAGLDDGWVEMEEEFLIFGSSFVGTKIDAPPHVRI